MIKWIIGAGVAAGLVGVSVVNYRRFIPASKPLNDKNCKIKTVKKTIKVGNKTLYGELLLPQGITEPVPLVICCHGYGSSYKLCKNLIGKSLAMSGYGAFCFDFYGGSKKSKSGGSMMEMSIFTEKEELLAVIDETQKFPEIDPAHLYLLGESQGGMVSGITAPERMDAIRALILYYPAFCIPADAHKKFTSKADIPEVTEAFNLAISRKYYADVWDFDVYKEIAGYTKPVLIIHGDKDAMVDISYGKQGAEAYKDCEFVTLPGEIHGFYGAGKKKAAELSYAFMEKHS